MWREEEKKKKKEEIQFEEWEYIPTKHHIKCMKTVGLFEDYIDYWNKIPPFQVFRSKATDPKHSLFTER